jgi:thymidine phosphorylase
MSITSEDVLKAIIGNKISIEEALFFLMEEAQSQFDELLNQINQNRAKRAEFKHGKDHND